MESRRSSLLKLLLFVQRSNVLYELCLRDHRSRLTVKTTASDGMMSSFMQQPLILLRFRVKDSGAEANAKNVLKRLLGLVLSSRLHPQRATVRVREEKVSLFDLSVQGMTTLVKRDHVDVWLEDDPSTISKENKENVFKQNVTQDFMSVMSKSQVLKIERVRSRKIVPYCPPMKNNIPHLSNLSETEDAGYMSANNGSNASPPDLHLSSNKQTSEAENFSSSSKETSPAEHDSFSKMLSSVEHHYTSIKASSSGHHSASSRKSSPGERHSSSSRKTSKEECHSSYKTKSPPAERQSSSSRKTSKEECHSSSKTKSPPAERHSSSSRKTSKEECHSSSKTKSPPAERHSSSSRKTSKEECHSSSKAKSPPAECHSSSSRKTSKEECHSSRKRSLTDVEEVSFPKKKVKLEDRRSASSKKLQLKLLRLFGPSD